MSLSPLKIPISEQNIISTSADNIVKISIPNTTFFTNISARIFFDRNGNDFPDNTEIAIFDYEKSNWLDAGIGPKMGHKDVLELTTTEEVNSFRFASNSQTLSCRIYVQLFNNA